MSASTFICDECRDEFTKGWSDENAAEEAAILFGIEPEDVDDMAIVCDDCFQAMFGSRN